MLGQGGDATVEDLCEKCAVVMKQQRLGPATFLARFFDVSVLSQHAAFLKKSAKGSAAVLGERIESEWRKNRLATISTSPDSSTPGKDLKRSGKSSLSEGEDSLSVSPARSRPKKKQKNEVNSTSI